MLSAVSFNHMVEYKLRQQRQLDAIFSSLADPTRRDIIARVAGKECSVGELVSYYHVSFAAISKQLKVLENARLIVKRKEGKKQMIAVDSAGLENADRYLEQYRQMWQGRFDKLESLLNEE